MRLAFDTDNPIHSTLIMKILLTGATGYVGGRLLPRLLASGHHVRCLARRPEYLEARFGAQAELVRGDLLDSTDITRALEGMDAAYYLVHAMGSKGQFENLETTAARNFSEAAQHSKLKVIIYLGGLGDDSERLSPHLRSRHQTGEILRGSGIPVIEFRASIVIGAGSLSFEMIRALVQKLPVMTTPRWVHVKAQPIAISDLLGYLEAPLEREWSESHVVEIGGRDVVSYGELMKEYASQRGLRRYLIPVPVLSPRISSLWLGLVTPLYARIGRKLIDSLRHPTVVQHPEPARDFPINPRGVAEAIQDALRMEESEFEATRWSDSFASGDSLHQWGGKRFGTRLVDSRSRQVPVPAPEAFTPIQAIGGKNGWYFANRLWRLRGFLDLLVGGVGMRRGRRHPKELRVGDVLDCWRVEQLDPGRRLRLAAEMKLPGRAWLEFEVTEAARGSLIRQTAIFDPIGLGGLLYWYGIYPLHALIFRGMLNGIVRAAAAA